MAQVLTRMALMVCRSLSFSAIFRLLCLSSFSVSFIACPSARALGGYPGSAGAARHKGHFTPPPDGKAIAYEMCGDASLSYPPPPGAFQGKVRRRHTPDPRR